MYVILHRYLTCVPDSFVTGMYNHLVSLGITAYANGLQECTIDLPSMSPWDREIHERVQLNIFVPSEAPVIWDYSFEDHCVHDWFKFVDKIVFIDIEGERFCVSKRVGLDLVIDSCKCGGPYYRDNDCLFETYTQLWPYNSFSEYVSAEIYPKKKKECIGKLRGTSGSYIFDLDACYSGSSTSNYTVNQTSFGAIVPDIEVEDDGPPGRNHGPDGVLSPEEVLRLQAHGPYLNANFWFRLGLPSLNGDIFRPGGSTDVATEEDDNPA